MTEQNIIGWDIGGAHLKVAALDRGLITDTRHYATPLWQGLPVLDQAIDSIRREYAPAAATHVMTMTGELVDLFQSRSDGVEQIVEYVLARNDSAANTYIYAGEHGFIRPHNIARHYLDIASGNWHATASLLAQAMDSGYLVDIGTTTTDIIPFGQGRVASDGYTDQQRLRTGELIYTGVVRTPVMAVVNKLRFQGQWQSVAAEYFACMADVYRLTGDLPPQFDLLPAADGGARTAAGSRLRLARMLGTDVDAGVATADWTALARFIADKQYELIARGFERVLLRHKGTVQPCVVAAGVGRFVIEKLAGRYGCKIIAFEDMLEPDKQHRPDENNCAAAIALARLFHAGRTAVDTIQ
ncbi:MAG: hydantoinase/oxoprolinase family protein [Gammaproteobacteria bacterium]